MGESIQSDDIYINKSTPLVTRSTGDAPLNNAVLPDSAYKHTPQKYKGPVGEACVVDRVLLTTNDDNCPTIKVCLRPVSISNIKAKTIKVLCYGRRCQVAAELILKAFPISVLFGFNLYIRYITY